MASSMECQLCTPPPNPKVRTTQNTHTHLHTHALIYFQVASFGGRVELYFGGGGQAPKSPQMVTAAMKLKDTCSLEEKL